jgi:starch synthase
MYSLRYGTLPVVRATGGLADSVADFDPERRTGTGFLFQRYEPAEMTAALRRALTAWRQPALRRELMRRGMAQDFSWRVSADAYDRLYDDAIGKVKTSGPITLETMRAQG